MVSENLQRNVSSQYYYRMPKTQVPEKVEAEMKELTSPYQDKLAFIKNPVIAEVPEGACFLKLYPEVFCPD